MCLRMSLSMRSSYIEGHVQVTQYFVYLFRCLILIGYSGGGGGSRTRVRKYVPEGIYMRVRFWCFAIGVKKRQKPPMAIVENSHRARIDAVRDDQPAE